MEKSWKLAIGLACIGSILALVNVYLRYQRTGDLAYGKIALAIGVPALVYGIARSRGQSG
jgi:hypothetical protein